MTRSLVGTSYLSVVPKKRTKDTTYYKTIRIQKYSRCFRDEMLGKPKSTVVHLNVSSRVPIDLEYSMSGTQKILPRVVFKVRGCT